MSIDRQAVEKLAVLARLSISEQDIAVTTSRLGDILQLVDQLQTADTNGVEPLGHPLDAQQFLRTDQITESDQREQLQALAPLCEDGLYLVPRVIE